VASYLLWEGKKRGEGEDFSLSRRGRRVSDPLPFSSSRGGKKEKKEGTLPHSHKEENERRKHSPSTYSREGEKKEGRGSLLFSSNREKEDSWEKGTASLFLS